MTNQATTTEPTPDAPERVTLWICCHCQRPRTVGLTYCDGCHKQLHDTIEYSRVSVPSIAPPNYALVQLLNAALLHPESAEGNVRQVIEALSEVAPVVDAFTFRHGADCAWERTTTAECEYKDTHHYCPHPEHACTCPQISSEISDNPTMEEAEAYLRKNGVTLEDVANAFIERLLQENLRLKESLASFAPASTAALRSESVPHRCVKCNHADAYLGSDGRCRAVVLGPDAMQGSGMAHCGCQCEFRSSAPASTVASVEQSNPTKCPARGEQDCVDHALRSTASPAALRDEVPTFKNTKEAMLYAQRQGIPAVVPCTPPSTAATAAKIADQLIPHLDHAFLLTKGWRDQIASIIERSLSSGS